MQQSYQSIRAQLLPPNTPAPLLPPARVSYPNLTSSISALSLHPCLEALLHILNRDLASAHFLVRHMESIVPPGNHLNDDQNSPWKQPQLKRPEEAQRPPSEDSISSSNGIKASENLDSQPPKIESMLLHGILHRIEGDYENARLWYRDVLKYSSPFPGESVLSHAWPPATPADSSTQPPKTAEWSVDDDGFPLGPSTFINRIRDLQRSRGKYENNAEANTQTASSESNKWHSERTALEKESEREIYAVLTWLEKRYSTEAWTDARTEYVAKSESSAAANKMIVGGEGWRQF